jgi:hypothetical protein
MVIFAMEQRIVERRKSAISNRHSRTIMVAIRFPVKTLMNHLNSTTFPSQLKPRLELNVWIVLVG